METIVGDHRWRQSLKTIIDDHCSMSVVQGHPELGFLILMCICKRQADLHTGMNFWNEFTGEHKQCRSAFARGPDKTIWSVDRRWSSCRM